jgi:hypothetical protein
MIADIAEHYGLPGPEIYHEIEAMKLETDLHGWHSAHPLFRELIMSLDETLPGGLREIAEVGSWKGASAIHMAKQRRSISPNPFRVICVDTWLGSLEHWVLRAKPEMALPRWRGYPQLYFQFLHNVHAEGCGDVITPVPLPSTIGAQLLARLQIQPQLIYLDGSHAYTDVRADLAAWWPMLAPGGVMFGDDLAMPGVGQAVKEFVARGPHAFGGRINIEGNFWVLRKWRADE